ncbi:MAG: hypothetical protein AB7P17_06485 [Nitrospirales bacterium]
MSLWVIPGAPFPDGQGWRIWCSHKGESSFTPPTIEVRQGGAVVPVQTAWKLLPVLPGLKRRMGIWSVRLQTPPPPQGGIFEVQVGTNNDADVHTFTWSTLPQQVTDKGVTFLLASCFWQNNDRDGYYRAGMRELKILCQPQFKMLIGDQVYLDWPIYWNFADKEPIELFAGRYRQYWGDDYYREILQLCPNFITCDDHEYWNDYPEKQKHLLQAWDDAHRNTYGPVADILYYHFQQCLNPDEARWYSFVIEPVSFFVTDTRSEREEFNEKGRSHFMSSSQWEALECWQQALMGPGVLVLGQPLFQKDGNYKDHSLSNFKEDYARLWRVIERSLGGENTQGKPHDILVLSGDIHTGRYAEAHGPFPDALHGVPEFIASPAAMINPGNDKPESPPGKIRVRPNANGGESNWTIDPDQHKGIRTIANNVGLVRMFPGSLVDGSPRVRFELELWQLPAKRIELDWDEEPPPQGLGGPLQQVFRKELLLR